MNGPRVLVVGETPSLGRAIVDLLDAYGVATRFAPEVDAAQRAGLRGVRVIVAAANSGHCPTLRSYLRGELAGPQLVIVGSRDPLAVAGGGVHPVGLPLVPTPFVQLVRSLAE